MRRRPHFHGLGRACLVLVGAGLVAVLVACGEESGTGVERPPDLDFALVGPSELVIGVMQQFAVEVRETNGTSTVAPTDVSWSTTDPAVLRVFSRSDGKAEVVPVSVGNAVLLARWREYSDSLRVNVMGPYRFEVVSGTPQSGGGKQWLPRPLVARVVNATGAPVPGLRVWTAVEVSVDGDSWTTASPTYTSEMFSLEPGGPALEEPSAVSNGDGLIGLHMRLVNRNPVTHPFYRVGLRLGVEGHDACMQADPATWRDRCTPNDLFRATMDPLPDLHLIAFEGSDVLLPDSMEVSFLASNVGRADAPETVARVALVPPDGGGNNFLGCAIRIPALTPNDTAAVAASCWVSPDLVGTWAIRGFLALDEDLYETDLGRNSVFAGRRVTVTPPS